MKNYIKIISVIVGCLLLWAVVYATVTTARTSWVNKLPYNWAGWVYNTANHRWPANAWDVARFTWTLWVGNVITDTRTGLMWESIPNSWSTPMTWDNAKIHCANLTVWWYTDWKLPNIRELMSIVDYSYSSSNYWYESKFTLVANVYRSSTTYGDDTADARSLDFNGANTDSSVKTSNNRVICTR